MIDSTAKLGAGVSIGDNVTIARNVTIMDGCIIGDSVIIDENSYIDYRVIIRNNTTIGKNCFIGANCILGEYQTDFVKEREEGIHPLIIGNDAVIRSNTVIYGDTVIEEGFNTGHNVTIREKTEIGRNSAIGTLCDIQGKCKIGNYVHLHSNVHIGQEALIEDYVWIFPYTVLTNDPTPPSRPLCGVTVKSFAILSAGTLILPGVVIGNDTLTAGGAVVTSDVEEFSVVGGCPAKKIADVRDIVNRVTGKKVYPWRYYFSEQMPWEDIGFEKWIARCNDEKIIELDKHTREVMGVCN